MSSLFSDETQHWFLAAVLARDSPYYKGNAPHRLMNLHTLVSVARSMMSPMILADLKAAICESLESDLDRYVVITISLMCAVFLTELFGRADAWSIDTFTNNLNSKMNACSMAELKVHLNCEIFGAGGPSDDLARKCPSSHCLPAP
jgi:hypothetical protein